MSFVSVRSAITLPFYLVLQSSSTCAVPTRCANLSLFAYLIRARPDLDELLNVFMEVCANFADWKTLTEKVGVRLDS